MTFVYSVAIYTQIFLEGSLLKNVLNQQNDISPELNPWSPFFTFCYYWNGYLVVKTVIGAPSTYISTAFCHCFLFEFRCLNSVKGMVVCIGMGWWCYWPSLFSIFSLRLKYNTPGLTCSSWLYKMYVTSFNW